MQIKFKRDVLSDALRFVSKASTDKSQASLLYRCVDIEVNMVSPSGKSGRAAFTCFDQTRLARITGVPVFGKVGHVPRIMTMVRELQAFVNASSSEFVLLELALGGSALQVFTDAHIELPLVDEEKNKFPVRLMATSKMKTVDLDKSDFLDWVVLCSKFTSKDSTKPTLGALYLSEDGTLMGTDSRSAFVLHNSGLVGPAMIRSELESLLADFSNTGQLKYYFSSAKSKSQFIQFVKGKKTVWSVVPVGKYPAKAIQDVQNRFAEQKTFKFRIAKKDLEGMLRRASAVELDDADAIVFEQEAEGAIKFRLPKKKAGRKFEELVEVKGKLLTKPTTVSRAGLSNAVKMCLGEFLAFEVSTDLTLPVFITAGKDQLFWVNRYLGE